ncbi:hypothetical protein V6N12_012925 [Hibiscus sabdariffa]|uniref:Uncharacterized protein n=1 Tax=Hibiscus sabdariffa TaxID=183260 RepID=A0ABR2EFU1_9ROSI
MKLCYALAMDFGSYWLCFLYDLWLPNLGLLIDWKATNAIVDDNLLVKDVVSDNGEWNWDLLRHLLQAVAILHILNLPVPSSIASNDHCCWSCG